MITIEQLKKMPVGEKIGGGFALTIKKTKKAVQLPDKTYIHTVVLFDKTGEMLADFKDQGGAGAYNPMIKGQEVKIIVAKIQHAEAGTKLYVDQFSIPSSGSEPKVGYEAGEDYPDWRTTVRGKIRHGIVTSDKGAGIVPNCKETEKCKAYKMDALYWEEFIMTGE